MTRPYRLPEGQAARALPHNTEAEASVLGGILYRNSLITMLDTLEIEDFYSPRFQAIFAAMRNLEATARPIDEITVLDELKRLGKSEAVGGLGTLAELLLQVPSVENVFEYVEIIQRHRAMRDTAAVASEVLTACYDTWDPDEQRDLIARATTKLMNLQTRGRDTAKAVGTLMLEELARIQSDVAAIERGETIVMGMPSGITRIDQKLGGHPIGMITAFLGGPGHGKSTYLGCSAAAVSTIDDFAFIYAFEDAEEYWAQRALAQESGVATQDIATRRLFDPGVLAALYGAAARAKLRKEFIQPSSGWTVDDVIADARARRQKLQSQLGGRTRRCVIYIDYIQVMRFVYGRDGIEKPHQAIKYAMDRLQWLAQGCGSTNRDDRFTVVVASQVKPEVAKEKRAPTKDDWVDGSSIVTVPKLLLGLNRPNTYDPNIDADIGEVRVLKRNQGDPDLQVSVVIDLRVHVMYDRLDATPPYPRLL